MATPNSNESARINETAISDRAAQAPNAELSKEAMLAEESSSRMRLDMDEIFGFKRR